MKKQNSDIVKLKQLNVCCHLSYRANEEGESLFVRASGELETLLRTTLCSV